MGPSETIRRPLEESCCPVKIIKTYDDTAILLGLGLGLGFGLGLSHFLPLTLSPFILALSLFLLLTA